MAWPRSRIAVVLCALVTVLASCSKREHQTTEEAFVANELVDLKAALAARDETKVLIGCVTTTTGLSRMPKQMVEEIERLCYIDAPRLLLENAVREATEAKAQHPEMADLNCMQLMAGDAFKTIAKHPTNDPTLTKLADEYTRLCPEQVAKFRSR